MSATLESKPKLPGFISLLLVIALGISLAKLMWLVITPQQQFVLTSLSNNTVSISQEKETNYGKLIADQHIFGEVIVKKVPVNTPVKTVIAKPVVPKVKLNAKLYGIVAYESKQGFALISNNNGPQKVYGEGDILQEGVIINKVLPTQVVIDNNGTEEILFLPVKNNGKKAQNRRVQSLQNLPTASPVRSIPVNNSASQQAPDLNQFRQEILAAGPSKLTDVVRASPAIINGQFIGFRVRSGKNRKLFRQLNFRPNDIVTEINGIVLDDANKGIEVLAELESATNLSMKSKTW